MRNPLRRFPLIAALALTACASSPKAPPPLTRPSLDQYLANDCQQLAEVPARDDFDALLAWVTGDVLPKYGDCAIRHRQTVEAWPKAGSP
jgi:hypothetical protein